MELSIYNRPYCPEVSYNYDIFDILNDLLVIEHSDAKHKKLKISNNKGDVGYIYKSYIYTVFNNIFFKINIYDKNHNLMLIIKQFFNTITVDIPGTNNYTRKVGKIVIKDRNYSLFTEKPFGCIDLFPGGTAYPLLSLGNVLGAINVKSTTPKKHEVIFDLSCYKHTREYYLNYKSGLDFFQRCVVLAAAISIDISRFLNYNDHTKDLTSLNYLE